MDFEKLREEFRKFYRQLPDIAGGQAVSFFKESFRRQGWVYNGSLQKWEQRKPGSKRNKGRALLVDTGRLRRSIRIVQKGEGYVKIGTDVPYAQAHNEGATITGTASIPGFRRKGGKVKKHKRGDTIIKAHTRTAGKVSAHTRNMNTTIPKRQFMGESPDVMKSVERAIFRRIDEIMKGL